MSVKKGTSYIAGRAQVDATPVSGSTNAVSSGGVYTALQDKAPASLSASVAALDAALSAKANDNQVVHTTGNETAGGNKVWTGSQTITSATPQHYFNNTAMDITAGTWASGRNTIAWCRDRNNYETGGIFNAIDSGGTAVFIDMYSMSRRTGSQVDAHIRLGVDASGTRYTSCPACNWNNSIVTTTAHSYGRNGYCKLGNGLIIQWGEWNRSTSATITFPTAFSNTNYSITIIGQNAQRYSWTTGKTSTNCTFNSADDASQNNDSVSQWIAIGY